MCRSDSIYLKRKRRKHWGFHFPEWFVEFYKKNQKAEKNYRKAFSSLDALKETELQGLWSYFQNLCW